MRTIWPKAATGRFRRSSTCEHQPVRSDVGHDKGLADDVSALQVGKALLKLACRDELLRAKEISLSKAAPWTGFTSRSPLDSHRAVASDE